ncbi:hypothetical protein PCC9214_05250 [Planktothrix tepida]|nr:hypothetical protein PCC9214_05250 [Planktothrix tepida]
MDLLAFRSLIGIIGRHQPLHIVAEISIPDRDYRSLNPAWQAILKLTSHCKYTQSMPPMEIAWSSVTKYINDVLSSRYGWHHPLDIVTAMVGRHLWPSDDSLLFLEKKPPFIQTKGVSQSCINNWNCLTCDPTPVRSLLQKPIQFSQWRKFINAASTNNLNLIYSHRSVETTLSELINVSN